MELSHLLGEIVPHLPKVAQLLPGTRLVGVVVEHGMAIWADRYEVLARVQFVLPFFSSNRHRRYVMDMDEAISEVSVGFSKIDSTDFANIAMFFDT